MPYTQGCAENCRSVSSTPPMNRRRIRTYILSFYAVFRGVGLGLAVACGHLTGTHTQRVLPNFPAPTRAPLRNPWRLRIIFGLCWEAGWIS